MAAARFPRLISFVLLLPLAGLACNLPRAASETIEEELSAGALIEQAPPTATDAFLQPSPTASPRPPTAAVTPTPEATPFGGGSMIAYLSNQDSPLGDVFVVEISADGPGQPVKLTNNSGGYTVGLNGPTWHPSGGAVTVIQNNFETTNSAILTLPLEPAEPVSTNFSQSLPHSFSAPDWSPTGDGFIFTRLDEADADLMLFTVGGSGPVPIAGGQGFQLGLDWSPQGGILYFEIPDLSELNPAYSADLFRMSDPQAEPSLVAEGIIGLNFARFSPDGSQIVYDSNVGGDYDIFVMNADGSNVRQLTSAPEPEASASWSPDGRFILFTRQVSDSNRDIYIMKADGTDQRPLITGPAHQDEAAWGP